MIGLIITSAFTILLTGLSVYYLFNTRFSIYTFGFIFSTIGAIGFVFKLLHLEGAGFMFGLNIFSFLAFAIIFIKRTFELKFKNGIKTIFYYLLSVLLLSIIILGLGYYYSIKQGLYIVLFFVVALMKYIKIYFNKEDGRIINILLIMTILYTTYYVLRIIE